jgi:hypothetical protein
LSYITIVILTSQFHPCSLKHDTWHTWRNSDGGVTPGIRTHLRKRHRDAYCAYCATLGYPVLGSTESKDDEDNIKEPITREGIQRYIAEMMASNDLV